MIISEKRVHVNSAYKVAVQIMDILQSEHETDRDREHFWIIGCDGQNNTKYIELVSLGGLKETIVEPRGVFRLALMKGVAAIILCHNHPGGTLEPSKEDLSMTAKLLSGANLLGIKILDHVIVGNGFDYFSFVDNGMISGEEGSRFLSASINELSQKQKTNDFDNSLKRLDACSERLDACSKKITVLKKRAGLA